MDADPAVRIQYASKYAQISNYWKYFIGQQKGLKNLKVYDKKKAQEDELMAWVKGDKERQAEYGDIENLLSKGYADRTQYEKASTYTQEALFGSETVVFGFRLARLYNALNAEEIDMEQVGQLKEAIVATADVHFSEFNSNIDKEVTKSMFELIHNDVEKSLQPVILQTVQSKFKGNFQAWADKLFATSILTDRARLDAFLANTSGKKMKKIMSKDLGFSASYSCLNHYFSVLQPAIAGSEESIAKGYRLMVKAMRENGSQEVLVPERE